MVRDDDLLRSAKSGKARAGKRELVRWLEGGKLTRSQAVKAHCYDCLGMGDSGDCDQETCPLLPFSPFNTLKRAFLRDKREKKHLLEGVGNEIIRA